MRENQRPRWQRPMRQVGEHDGLAASGWHDNELTLELRPARFHCANNSLLVGA
jgi:hypothetical protein